MELNHIEFEPFRTLKSNSLEDWRATMNSVTLGVKLTELTMLARRF